jgi:hypothetical protein
VKEFILTKAPAKISSGAKFITSSTIPHGSSAKPVSVSELQFELKIDVNASMKSIEALFPGVSLFSKEVAGLEFFKGEDRKTRANLPDMNLKIWYADGDLVLDTSACVFAGKPKLRIDKNGDGTLIVSPKSKITESEFKSLRPTIGTDIDLIVSMEPSQLDFSSLDEVITEKPLLKKSKKISQKQDQQILKAV